MHSTCVRSRTHLIRFSSECEMVRREERDSGSIHYVKLETSKGRILEAGEKAESPEDSQGGTEANQG